MQVHEFRDPLSNAARDDILTAMRSSGAISTPEIFRIGRKYDLYDGVITGIIGTLHKKGAIQSAGQGWWELPESVSGPDVFRAEICGEVELIGPRTSRVGEVINHDGINYYRGGGA